MLDSDMETGMRMMLYLGMILSAEGLKELMGVVGGYITLPDSLMERGFFSHNSAIIASVKENKMEILEETYTDKLHWDKQTGEFTIMNLQRSDSGVYKFDSKKGKVFQSGYNLMVFEPAPPPAVRRLNDRSEPCLLLCWVDKETELSWYRDGKILNQSSSDVSLLLAVDKEDFSSSYTCVSANPAERKTLPVHVNTLCREANPAGSLDADSQRNYRLVAVTVISAVFILMAVGAVWRTGLGQKKRLRLKQDCENRQTLTQEHADAHSQGGSFPASAADPSCLTTVHYKLVLTPSS